VVDQISWQEIWSLTEREKVVSRKEKMRLPAGRQDAFIKTLMRCHEIMSHTCARTQTAQAHGAASGAVRVEFLAPAIVAEEGDSPA